MPFSFTHVAAAVAGGPGVMIVSLQGGMDQAHWPQYEAAYRRMYATTAAFVLVFDARSFGLPDLAVVQAKMRLMQAMKHRTVCQVAAVVVLTEYDLIKRLVNTLVRAGGQAAPFQITTCPKEAAAIVADHVQAAAGSSVASYKAAHPLAPTFGDVDGATLVALVLLRFVLFQRHFLRNHVINNKKRLVLPR